MINKTSILAFSSLILVGAAQATTIFDATTANTTLVGNASGVGTLTGTPGSLLSTTNGTGFNNSGFTSTADINALNGTALTVSDTVTISLSVSGITGALRSNGITFGLNDQAASGGTGSGMLLNMEISNVGNDINIVPTSFQDVGDTGFNATDAQISDGFDLTLVADVNGYEFTLISVGATSPITIAGTFAGTEFVDNFGSGYFYYTAQQFNTGAAASTITEASIAVVPEPGIYALLTGLTGLAFVMVRRRRA